MRPKIVLVYKAARTNAEFCADYMTVDDKNTLPRWYTSDLDKNIFACFYCGWLTGKYGAEVAKAMYEKIVRGEDAKPN